MASELLKILIIDDDPVDRAVLKQYLDEAPDFTPAVHEASSGREGIALFAALHPDCILLDYRLPDLDGIEVVRALNGTRTGCAIVMLTAIGNEQVAVEAMKAGVMDYANKGAATSHALHRIVRNAVDKSRLQAQLEEQRAAVEERNRELEEAVKRELAARREAESSRQEYRVLVETIPQVVWRSTKEGIITFGNERWRQYAGGLQSTGQTWMDAVHPEDRSAVQGLWTRAVESAGGFESEARLLRCDGQHRWHLVCAVPSEGGTWLCTGTDVTDQKEAQQALLQQQKLDSIGLLAGGVAHDFNNLLVGIMGSASFALDTVPETHPAHSLLENVVDASERAAHLTRQLLAYAGKGQFAVEPIDLTNLVSHTVDLVESFVPKTVQLQLELDSHLPVMQSDSGQVEQVIMNLMINAAEAIGQARHGLIAVRTYPENVGDGEPVVDAWGAGIPAGRYVVLQVQDSGCGMTDDTRARIFDPFFTTKFTGRGLGLAAVQGIVRSNHGAIQVNSAEEKGTTFRVYFPATETPAAAPAAEESETGNGQGTILVIDDEPTVRKVAQVAMKNAGYSVLSAENGLRGVELILADPDITSVLLDMSMPGMTGPEALTRIHDARPDLPVIICSGFSEGEVRRQFAGLSLAGVIQKPFTAQKLAARVNAILGAYARTAMRISGQ